MLIKFLKTKSLTIKDWVKIEDKEKRDDDKEKVDKFYRKGNTEEVAVLLDKTKAKRIFQEFKENITQEVRDIEKEKSKSILYFGYIIENFIGVIIESYTDIYEGMILSKTDVRSIEEDKDLLKDYHNFKRIAKIINEEVRLDVLNSFSKLYEKCLNEGKEGCIESSSDYSKKIIREIKKGFNNRLDGTAAVKEEFITQTSQIDKEMYFKASREISKITNIIDESIKKTHNKLQNIERETDKVIKRLYE